MDDARRCNTLRMIQNVAMLHRCLLMNRAVYTLYSYRFQMISDENKDSFLCALIRMKEL